MEYKRMDETHVSQVAHLEKLCFSCPWNERAVASELENPLSLWIVAVEENIVTGYVGSQSVMGEADMMNLAVLPECRRKGIAEKLVRNLIQELSRNDVSSLTLEVRVSNVSAIALYEKLGFSEIGRRPGYYRNPREDALILKKEW